LPQRYFFSAFAGVRRSRGCLACTTAATPHLPSAKGDGKPVIMQGFLAENRQALLECNSETHCDIALFNLGFIYAYSKSPHFNQPKGLGYFEELIQLYRKAHGHSSKGVDRYHEKECGVRR